MATKHDDSTLTGAQEVALRSILSSSSVTDAARQANVARQTVSTWLHHDPAFMAAVNAGRQDAHAALLDRLRDLGTQALNVIERRLDDADTAALGAALEIVKLMARLPAPTGETDALTIKESQDLLKMLRY